MHLLLQPPHVFLQRGEGEEGREGGGRKSFMPLKWRGWHRHIQNAPELWHTDLAIFHKINQLPCGWVYCKYSFPYPTDSTFAHTIFIIASSFKIGLYCVSLLWSFVFTCLNILYLSIYRSFLLCLSPYWGQKKSLVCQAVQTPGLLLWHGNFLLSVCVKRRNWY